MSCSLEALLCPHWHRAEDNCCSMRCLISMPKVRWDETRLTKPSPFLVMWSDVWSLSMLGNVIWFQGEISLALSFSPLIFLCSFQQKFRTSPLWAMYLFQVCLHQMIKPPPKSINKLNKFDGLVWVEPHFLWSSVAFISELESSFGLLCRVIWRSIRWWSPSCSSRTQQDLCHSFQVEQI